MHMRACNRCDRVETLVVRVAMSMHICARPRTLLNLEHVFKKINKYINK